MNRAASNATISAIVPLMILVQHRINPQRKPAARAYLLLSERGNTAAFSMPKSISKTASHADFLTLWHIDRFKSLPAAEAARGRNGAVVQIFWQVWLFTIADQAWQSSGGEHLANVGPLELPVAQKLLAA